MTAKKKTKNKNVLVIELTVRVPDIDDPDGEEAELAIQSLQLDLKTPLEGWNWSLDEAYVASIPEDKAI